MLRIRSFITLLCAALLASGCERTVAGARPPNVVLIVVDTLRADHVDEKAGLARVPHLRALAEDGVAFPHAFTHVPITLPAHTSLFSSQIPMDTGVRENAQAVPKDLPLLSGWLEEHGYTSCAAVTLASLWPSAGGRGLDRGFDRYARGQWSVTRGEELDWELSTTLDQVSKHQPFFLFAHYSDPHEPYDAHGSMERYAEIAIDDRPLGVVCTSDMSQTRRELPLSPGEHVLEITAKFPFKVRSLQVNSPNAQITTEFTEGELQTRTDRARVRVFNPSQNTVTGTMSLWIHDALAEGEIPARYRSEVEYTDRCVGLLIADLKRRGLYDSSVIVFTSDHGEGLGEHGTFGHVVHLYDELLHVPLIIKLPSQHPGRPWLEKTRNDLVRLIDIAPTLLDVLGLPPLPDQEGVSLLKPGVSRVLVAQTQREERGKESKQLFCLRDDDYKLIWYPGEKRFEMYDLKTDPAELTDVYETLGKQRPQWQQTLRDLAANARRPGEATNDPELKQRIESLGYGD